MGGEVQSSAFIVYSVSEREGDFATCTSFHRSADLFVWILKRAFPTASLDAAFPILSI